MAGKIFTLETVAAKYGDCLLLHWGSPSDPRVMLIDGGPPGVYNRFLKKRLDQLRQTRGDPLALTLVMVSHIDDDHIAGVLDVTDRLEELEDQGRDAPYEIEEMWFNSFDDIVGNVQVAAFGADVGAAGLAPEHRHAGSTIASVGQGRRLRDAAERMGVLTNGGDDLLVGGWIWDMGDGLSFHVVGPRQNRIDEFQTAWDKEVEKKGWDVDPDAASVAAYLDQSPYNLASTVVLAKVGSKSMLLTGDARGDDILEGLREGGLLTGNSMKVDVLKIPHHGSDRNVRTDFFRQVRADHYIVSGDGRHGNPEVATLEMIRSARGRARYTVHLTYRDLRDGHRAELDGFLSNLSASERRKFVFRPDGDLSFKVDLGRKVAD